MDINFFPRTWLERASNSVQDRLFFGSRTLVSKILKPWSHKVEKTMTNSAGKRTYIGDIQKGHLFKFFEINF